MIRPILRGFAWVGAGLWLTLAPALAGDAPAQSARSAAEIMDILMWNREPVGGPFALTDQAGHARTDRDFRGRLMLVYFGFTFCPDVCPTDLQAIGLALDRLGPDGDQVQPIFITVDPERDTASHLADYVPMFHPRLIGLTGSADAIRKVADLRGRKVSIFRGTNNHLAAVKVLAGNGLQERDVQIINMDTATTNAALTSKDIDAAFGNFPLASLAEKNIAEIIYTTKGDNPAYERHSTLIGQDAFIKAHPDITQKIVSAIVRAARWASDEANREAFFEISARTGFPASGYRFDFSNQELKYRNTPIIDASIIESYRVQARQAREFGLLRRDVDLNGWFDRSFLDIALKEQGLVGYWQEYDASGRPQAAGQ